MVKKSFYCFTFFVVLISSCFSQANYERIKLFKSDVYIDSSGQLTVVETITVTALGNKIKRGIYREFPTRYKTNLGNPVEVSFNVLSVQKNGQNESFKIKEIDNGEAVYIGKNNVFLDPGDYSYEITYETSGQLGFFDEYDELYWNVNGLDWDFMIDSLVCIIHLPKGKDASFLEYTGFSGFSGESKENYTISFLEDGSLVFSTVEKLNPHEGLTIAASWPKGLVQEPTELQSFYKNYSSIIYCLIVLIVVFTYYYIAWRKVGVDPKKDVAYPLYYPPEITTQNGKETLPPSGLSEIINYGLSHDTLTSEIVQLASKGALLIKEYRKGKYILLKKSNANLSELELNILDALFDKNNPGEELLVDNENHKKFTAAKKVIKDYCKNLNKDNKFVSNNLRWILNGVLLSLFGLIIVWFTQFELLDIFGVAFTLLPGFTLFAMVTGKPQYTTPGCLFKGLGYSVISVFLIIGILFLIGSDSILMLPFLLGLIVINFQFGKIMKAPTKMGQKLLAQIEGFKMYLKIGEELRLKYAHPPEITQEVFEKYLSYAITLGVENEWASNFEKHISNTSTVFDKNTIKWFDSSLGNFSAAALTTSLSTNFSSATSSSSMPPGSRSSSGGGFSGGGGSSGGGGGGGGGGGW